LDEKCTKFIAIPRILSKLANSDVTELYCLFIAADSIVDAISFTGHIVLWSEKQP